MFFTMRFQNVKVGKMLKDGQECPPRPLTVDEQAHLKLECDSYIADMANKCVSALRARFPKVLWDVSPCQDDPGLIVIQASAEFDPSEVVPIMQRAIRPDAFELRDGHHRMRP
jgi:hypothetical protein